METSSILAIDAGATKTRARLILADGRVSEATVEGFPVVTAEGGAERAVSVLRLLAERLPLPERIGTVVLGANSVHVPHPAVEALVLDVLGAALSFERAIICSDMVTSYVGALGLSSGVVLAAGTGAIAMAVDADLRAHRVDGLGAFLGDHGSGFRIGHEALTAVYRDPTAESLRALRDAWIGIHGSLEAGAHAVYGGHSSVQVIASFARPVIELADSDPAARAFVRHAAEELRETIRLAADLAAPGAPVTVLGSLATPGNALHRDIVELLAPHTLAPALGDALDGAVTLARSSSPLFLEVSAWHQHP
ncbi:N-acetylglucosamine kinase [Mycetocola tolaasinivorans]|nr:BadF/BadG/BcrA/BcrD ATPase family protein [Mycetocola tolaasinivorans]